MSCLIAALLLTVLGSPTLPQPAGPIKRVRYPALSPDAKTMAFSYQGDIWMVASESGRAERLTVHPAADSMPKWSPDGASIAFSSGRHGNLDVFFMTREGGTPQRLTFSSADDYVMGWTPDSRWVVFYTRRWGQLEVMKVRAEGGEPIRLTVDPMEAEFFPAVSPDGKRLAYCHGGGPGNWRRSGMTGSGTADVWVADFTSPLSSAKNITRDERPQLWPMWSADGKTIWFVGDDGTPNLWRMSADGNGRRKVTTHTTDRVRYPAISADGSAIAYEYASEAYVFDIEAGKSRRVEITIPGDQRYNEVTRQTLAAATDYAVSPNGKRMLVVSRAEILLTPEAGGATRRMTTFVGRDEEPLWKDDKEFFYVTLVRGSKDVNIMDLDGKARPFLSIGSLLDPTQRGYTAPGLFGDEMALALSPDRKTLAFHRGVNEIWVVPVEGGQPKIVFKGYFGGALFGSPEFSWGPDNRHIAVTNPTERGGSNIYLVDTETVKSTLIARAARGTGTPGFTADGKRVFFTANEYESSDLFVVELVPEPVEFEEDALEKIDEKKDEKKKEEPVKIEVQAEGIFNRMRRLTSGPDSVGGVISDKSGENLFFTMGGQIHKVPAKGGSSTALTSTTGGKSALRLSPDGTKLYFLHAGKVNAMTLANQSVAARSFSADVEINQYQEARALFDEIWWVMDRVFYDPEHHGYDWGAIRSYYESLLPHAYDRAEFYDLMQEMIHEINSSHLGVSGPTQQPQTGDDATGVLGVEPDWPRLEAQGRYVIAKVLRGSPAAHPQSKLNVGEMIVSVDGQFLGKAHTLDALLNHKAGRKAVLKVRGADGAERYVAIKPISLGAQSGLSYDNFVQDSRELVEKYSGGRIAYVHIQGMSMPSHELFMREVRTLTQGKEGLVIDVRYNGGGSTAHLALGMLIKRPWLVRTNRGWEKKISENLYRGDSVELPAALMINQSSFSNAEIFAEGFKRLGIGPVVGVATPGGVIGTAGWILFDGGSLRTPLAGAYTVDGENLEGKGRRPDYPVAYDPNEVARGEDPQLRKAVDVLLERLSKR